MAPVSDIQREPCPRCGEPAALSGRVCPHCQGSLLVDVGIPAPVTDPRIRYQLARELSALGGPAPAFSAAQRALASPRPSLAQGVSRSESLPLVELLEAHGLQAWTSPAGAEATLGLGAGKRHLLWLGGAAAAVLLAFALWPHSSRQEGDGASTAAPEPASAPAPAAAVSSRPLSTRELADLATPSTVALRCGDSLGSGFFVERDLVLTNAHVVESCGGGVTVVFSDGRQVDGSIEREEEALDLAVVRVSSARAEPLQLGDATSLHTGDRVVFIGTPEGLQFTVHEGIISNTARHSLGMAYLQLDANVNPGNSGGPVIDSLGRVVGVVTAKVEKAEGLGFMLPINYAYEGDRHLLAKPSPPPDPRRWRDLLAQVAEADRQSVDNLADAARRPILLGVARSPLDGEVYAAIGRFAPSEPPGETAFFTFRKPDRMVCSVTSEVESWKPAGTNGFGNDPRIRRWLEKNGIPQTFYQGLARLNLKDCPRQELPGSEMVLEGADEEADRIPIS